MTKSGADSPPHINRRRIVEAGVLFGAFTGAAAAAPPPPPSPMARIAAKPANWARTHLHQDETFNATPARVYQALLSSAQFAAFSHEPATIDPAPGGTFSLFAGRVVGRNIELVPNQRIVQAWRVIADWPPGVYSLVRMELTPKDSGTALSLDHTGFREGDFDHLNAGWAPHYWDPMRKYFDWSNSGSARR